MGCSNSEEETATETEQVLNLVSRSDISTLDFSKKVEKISSTVMNNVFEGLYRLGEGDSIQPGVAVGDPVVSEDGLTWTFTLNEDAKWSNGEPVTAHDFVYSWQRTIDPVTASENAYLLYPVKNAEAIHNGEMPVEELGVKADSDYQLTVTLEQPTPYFQMLLTHPTYYPLNEEFVEAQGDKYGTESSTTLYNGPFVLSEWEHEVGWTYAKNENYWDAEAVSLSTINVKIVKDQNTALNMYLEGEIDRVEVFSEQVPQVEDREDFHQDLTSTVYYLKMNLESEVLSNENARHAISLAINREELANEVLNDGSVPANYIVPQGFAVDEDGQDFQSESTYVNEDVYNVELAQEYWAIALEELGMEEVTLTLLNFDTEASKSTGEYIQNQLETNLPGLTVEVKQVPNKQKLDMEANGDYDLSHSGLTPSYPDPLASLEVFMSDNGKNNIGYASSTYDEMIENANSVEYIFDQEARWEMLNDAEDYLIYEDYAIVPLYQKGTSYLQSPKVENLYMHKFGSEFSYKWVEISE